MVSAFSSFRERVLGTRNSNALLWNLRAAEVQELGPGVTLRPLGGPVAPLDLSKAGEAGFLEWQVLVPMAPHLESEIESIDIGATTSGFDTRSRGWLGFCLLLLRGCGRALPVAISGTSWSQLPGLAGKKHLDAPFSDATLLEDYRLHFRGSSSTDELEVTSEKALWVRGKFNSFNELAHKSPAFRYALEASFDWRYSHDVRASIARIWGGIEALFEINAELTYRLSISAASLLTPRGAQRVARYSEIKRMYAQRSKAVHGAQLDDRSLSATLDQSFVLLRDLLVYAADRGRVFDETDILSAIME
jgi:hypothetical protein